MFDRFFKRMSEIVQVTLVAGTVSRCSMSLRFSRPIMVRVHVAGMHQCHSLTTSIKRVNFAIFLWAYKHVGRCPEIAPRIHPIIWIPTVNSTLLRVRLSSTLINAYHLF
jgi:hypothetical protein